MAALKVIASLCMVFGLSMATDPTEGDLFEGDMELNSEQKMGIGMSVAGIPTFAATKYPNWPRVIPYEIDSSLANQPRAISAINAAIGEFYSKTCLRFRKRSSSDKAYLIFQYGRGCSSPVGYWKRPNRINLASGCWTKGIVVHEIMHSLGFYHEQSRPDRDNHVYIQWQNIQPTKRFNFNKYDYGRINTLGSRYDYDSIMHYGPTAFGSGRVTIRTRDSRAQSRIGQRRQLSVNDIYQLKRKYGC